MHKHRITSVSDPLYQSFIDLYQSAFPLHEQHTAQHHLIALSHSSYRLICFVQENKLVGFVCYWRFTDYLYIEHYAINTHFRGQGYGSRLLNELLGSARKTVILEIDPIVDSVSEKRLKFYKNLGFIENCYSHYHLPYRQGFAAHNLVVLSYAKTLTPEQYRQFKYDLDRVVMFKGPNTD